jgi:LPXTG-motif cell wall-anchored protein
MALTAGTSAPEIDSSTGAAALALLAGGILVIRGRRKS